MTSTVTGSAPKVCEDAESDDTLEKTVVIREEVIIAVQLCETVSCRRGEHCVFKDDVAICECLSSCPQDNHPVCGSNRQTYASHCHLHREACLENKRLRVIHRGPCSRARSTERHVDDEEASIEFIGTTTHERPFTPVQPRSTNESAAVVATHATVLEERPTTLAAAVPIRKIDVDTCDHSNFALLISNIILHFQSSYGGNKAWTLEEGNWRIPAILVASTCLQSTCSGTCTTY
ncbi:unnamed protein product [Soboliphyme baturini]|uniref:Kazal-like domain-containing protein n=1 Tax=Soboliphyme baturini TaxID=241478 RepID=A0A183IEX0_9BILA|nr:unnamed protein product [Soboliphyme baturini]